ncbi:MAG: hybrid sensor histidine kinase/response regulator [bacterium]
MKAQHQKENTTDKSETKQMKERSCILVVDDNENNLALLEEGLSPAGYEVITAPDGFEGFKKAVQESPDLILLDIMMPQIDGYKVCGQLKKNPDTADIPVIFITALEKTTDIVRGFKVGGVDYITKPVIMEEVLARVGTHLKIKKLEQEKLSSLKGKMRAEHWEAVKSMSEGIAHNFNNLLSSAMGNSEFIMKTAAEEDVKEAGEDILSMLKRTATLVKHIQFLQEMNPETKGHRVRDLLSETVEEFKENMENGPEIHLDVPEEMPELAPGSGTYLKRALIAVLENARESTSADDGKIRVRARTVTHRAAQKIEITVEDNGKGIDEQTRIRAFLPFFSTKHTVGAGLGLYVARLAIGQLQGDIEIDPGEKEGAIVKIWIPVT